MPRVAFTANLQRHVSSPPANVFATSVREALEAVFIANPQLRGYVLDETNSLRKHMVIFIDGEPILDRAELSDPINDYSEIYIMQSLSGG